MKHRELSYVEHKIKRICGRGVKQWSSALLYIPIQYQSQQMCVMAVKDEPRMIEFISGQYITQETCESAF